MDLKIRRRNRLKSKQTKALLDDMEGRLGITLWNPGAVVEEAEAGESKVLLVNNKVLGLYVEDEPFLSLRGLLAHRPEKRWVTVDMGAVRFVTNGADIMAPGITEADPDLQPGDACWIRDEKNGQPLAVGQCMIPGADMGPATGGKAVRNIHTIGDKLWLMDE